MKTIPIFTTKKLIDKFIERLRQSFEDELTWLENSYPAVEIGRRENNQNYPQVYMNNGTLETIDLQPDNSLKSYCFFEKNTAFWEIPEREQVGTYSLSVIFWFNLQSINLQLYDFTEQLVNDVLNVLFQNNCINVKREFGNPFARYGIKETNNQYLMYPYNSFKLTFDVKNKYCL